jgi:hypothetical protein
MERAEAMRDVVEISHCFQDCFVFGGYVRDAVINNEAARDIDVVFSSIADRAIFERFLHNKYATELVEEREGYDFFGQGFAFCKLRVSYGRRGRSFDVDMSVKSKLDLKCTDHDFSCNTIYYSRTGMEVFSSEKDDRTCSPFVSAVEMIKRKVFQHTARRKGMELTPGNMCKYSSRLIRRADKMIQRGWIMRKSPGTFEVNTHGYLQRCNRFPNEKSCVVCSDDFEDADPCLITNCQHIFHTHCLVKWVEVGRSTITCPTCRLDSMLYSPSTGITTRAQPVQRIQVLDDLDDDDEDMLDEDDDFDPDDLDEFDDDDDDDEMLDTEDDVDDGDDESESERVDGIALVIPQNQTSHSDTNSHSGTTIARQRPSGGPGGSGGGGRFSLTFSI